MKSLDKLDDFFSERYFVREANFQSIFESFFVSAVIAILAIRIFLKFTNYPQLGGGEFHIAHMLWGGILMLIAIILLLTFLGRTTKRIAAVLGGFGFGTFIDELGKFITRDNNYFFQPTFAIIYAVFIILYVVFYSFGRYWDFSAKEYLINSIELLKEAVIGDLSLEEKRLALKFLRKTDKSSPIASVLEDLYVKIDTIPEPKANIINRVEKWLEKFYSNLIGRKWFKAGVNIFFIIKFLVGLILVGATAYTVFKIVFESGITVKEIYSNTIDILDLFSSSLAGIFVVLGVIKMKGSRLEAYKMFKKSVLISIFLVQFFSFYQEQLSAFEGLIFNIFVLVLLNSMIHQEQIQAKEINN